MPDDVTIAIAGDYGTGNFGAGDSPSTKISKFISSLNPDYTIHLGDVYYAGTSGEEISKLTALWPRGSKGSFALNSNHEMYSGGDPYFNLAVGGPVFNSLQSPYSFFALENANWIVVGLDSAYNADVLKLYMDGSLGNNAQIPFLKDLAARGKNVVVLTHHNGIPENGVAANPPLKLFEEVTGAFVSKQLPKYWYWGHVHAGVAYKPMATQNGMLCRCVGHSALPWGLSSDLQASSYVDWFETRSAKDPENSLRVLNGFVVLKLAGNSLTETFYDENGGIAWTPKK
jgi:Calcineurin-like phosphoesterase